MQEKPEAIFRKNSSVSEDKKEGEDRGAEDSNIQEGSKISKGWQRLCLGGDKLELFPGTFGTSE